MINDKRLAAQPMPAPKTAAQASPAQASAAASAPKALELPAQNALQLSPAASTAVRKPLVLPLIDPVSATADWGNVSVADRQANLKQLQSLARDLKAQGRPGVEIWSKLTQAAVDAYAGKQLPAARKSDFVMQDITIAVVGGDALKHLESYRKLPWVRTPDPMVTTFFKDWQAMGIPPADGNWERAGWAGDKLDSHNTADFRPAIADGSANQIYHTLFYHFMAYTTQAPFTIHGGSIVHEFKDEGTSSEDHNACIAGVTTGMALRRMRDGNDPEGSLQDWAAMTRAAYGKDGGPGLAQAGQRAQAMDRAISGLLAKKHPVWKAENFVIDVVKHVKNLFD